MTDIDAINAELYDSMERANDALHAERHARQMDAAQYTARIAELERELAEAKAIPVDSIRFYFMFSACNHRPTPEGMRQAEHDIQAWIDSLDAQDAANDAAMARWDAGN